MIIIDPSFEIRKIHTREDGIDLLREVEYYARISHRTEDRQTPDSWERFLQSVILEKGDWSVTEHEKITVVARVDRGVTHEWVRHRIGAYTQESTRFVNYAKRDKEGNLTHEIEFVKPSFTSEQASSEWVWRDLVHQSEIAYLDLLGRGVSAQIARSVLPNATASTIACTYDLRQWRHFFMMRTTKEAHPDFRRVTTALLRMFQERVPLLYDDIVPEQKQSISIARAR